MEQDVQHAVARICRETNVPFETSGPEAYQDGATFMSAEEFEFAANGHKVGVLSGFYFSKFGRLVLATRNDGKSKVPPDLWEELLETLCSDYEFRIVDNGLLEMPYEGVFDAYRCPTWAGRFFCPWYSHPRSGAAKAWS